MYEKDQVKFKLNYNNSPILVVDSTPQLVYKLHQWSFQELFSFKP